MSIKKIIADAKSKNRLVAIGTHDGPFHADEVFAIAAIQIELAPNGCSITRSRNPEFLANCDLRIDVGGKYCPETGDFDHHQDASLPASCNLVWDDIANGEIKQYVLDTLLNPISGLDCNFTKFSAENPLGIYKTVGQAIIDFNDIDGDQSFAFHQALAVAKMILENTIRKGRQYNADIERIKDGTPIGEFGLELNKAISYNEYRGKFGGRHILVYPDPVNGWCVVSLDTNQTNLSAAQELFGAVFAHKAGFFTKFDSRQKAVEYAAGCSEARSQEIDQWAVCHNDGNGARTH